MLQTSDLAGTALDGRYELHALIGEGTFGRVYRGHDRRLERSVAVKVIKPWWAQDSAWVARFEREAQLLARVSDPGIVQIYDIGHAEQGPYYVAELVLGESLAQRLRRGPLAPAQAASVGEQLARALAAAHAQGVLHCDVKPANVLIGPRGRVKVGDFGVARIAAGTPQELSATVAGTPRYMSPEQARGRPTTPATDVYSAGVVLYEMLAGEPPFAGDSPVELGVRHLQDTPPPLPPEVPPPLRAVVERSLAKDPAKRYSDGAHLADALNAAAESLPAAEPRRRARPAAGPSQEPSSEEATAATVAQPRRPAPGPAATLDARAARTRVLARGTGGDGAGGARAGSPRSPGPNRRPPRLAAAAGLLAVGGAGVAVLLLGGPAAQTTVPELRGLPRGGVLARAGRLHVSPSFSSRSSAAPAGLAIAQSPDAGTRTADGSTVRVVLSSGPPPVSVPGVVGEASAAAEQTLASAGLRYAVDMVPARGATPNVVRTQAPGPDATVPHGSTIRLGVAEEPRWRTLTTFSGVDDGESVPFRILGQRWRVSYSMSYRETCLLLFVCLGPSAKAQNLESGAGAGEFELGEGSSQAHVFDSGPGLYRLGISGGRDSASWTMSVQDYY